MITKDYSLFCATLSPDLASPEWDCQTSSHFTGYEPKYDLPDETYVVMDHPPIPHGNAPRHESLRNSCVVRDIRDTPRIIDDV